MTQYTKDAQEFGLIMQAYKDNGQEPSQAVREFVEETKWEKERLVAACTNLFGKVLPQVHMAYASADAQKLLEISTECRTMGLPPEAGSAVTDQRLRQMGWDDGRIKAAAKEMNQVMFSGGS